jgi:hypothetical protein
MLFQSLMLLLLFLKERNVSSIYYLSFLLSSEDMGEIWI